ncbi:GNAT family N-acetyltransferase [Vibrio parahaemolyticus]|uniref:GNAT family N-acetyltransferase n=1 Tax=Vibrio parahaemolyticus TaxID=670 RepID=UPI0011232D31|nr:GNAT family N-acetyltransferase [Vibrio parahaemolyticus]TOH24824.1 GNAT family N-acetyltransferase [Vibrio parahaemolyticus]HCG9147192.1 GNAT family N-acetyltransferase [Vibrio parahaemolyticus]
MEISLLAEHRQYVSEIASWYFDEWASKVPNVTIEMVRSDIDLKAANTKLPFSLVAHENGELIGTLELKIRENKKHPEYEHWIGGVYVPTPRRGIGIAKALINKAKKIAVDNGVTSLYLQYESHNVDLYVGQGFRPLHQSSSNNLQTTIMVWCTAT